MASVSDLVALSRNQSGIADLPGGGTHTGGNTIVSALAGILGIKTPQKKKKEEDNLKLQQDRASMYRTLRLAGYDPKTAHEAVVNDNAFPGQPGGQTLDEVKAQGEQEMQKLDMERKGLVNEKIKNKQKSCKKK